VIDEAITYQRIIKVFKNNASVSNVRRICQQFLADEIIVNIHIELSDFLNFDHTDVNQTMESMTRKFDLIQEKSRKTRDPE